MTPADLDPRVWNLFAGVALVTAGCGARVAGHEAGETGETADSVDTTPEGPEAPPECTSDSDCPQYYECYQGMCMYYAHHDGWVPYYDCYSNDECPEFETCEFGYCVSLGDPPPDCLATPTATTIPVPEQALALTFANVDGQGQDELVVATATGLMVFANPFDPPTISPREPGEVVDMVAGELDAMPGEDLLLLIDGVTITRYGSLGDGTFGPANSEPVAMASASGLIAGDYDEGSPTDLLVWGPDGAYVLVRGNGMLSLAPHPIDGAATLELDSPAPGYFLRRDDSIHVFGLDGSEIHSWSAIGVGAPDIAAVVFGEEAYFANVVHYWGWSLVEARDPTIEAKVDEWPIHGTPTQLLAGDLDGDGNDDLVFNSPDGLAVELDPRGPSDCWVQPTIPVIGLARGVAFGDFDGDGDEELGLLTDLGELAVLDGE